MNFQLRNVVKKLRKLKQKQVMIISKKQFMQRPPRNIAKSAKNLSSIFCFAIFATNLAAFA
jgi:hypothetical protein